MATSALPSNALYDVQRYLRQKRATGAQVTPQSERAAWSGYYDTMEQNSLGERTLGLQSERLNLLKQAQQNEEDAAKIKGYGEIVSTLGQGAMLLKGTKFGDTIGLGATKTGTPVTTDTTVSTTAKSGVAPITTDVTATGTQLGSGAQSLISSQGAVDAAANMSNASGVTGAIAEGGGGLLSASAPYTGPVAAGFAGGSFLTSILGSGKRTEVPVGALGGAAAGAVTGAAMTSWSGPGAIVGAVIGAVAGGVGAKVK